MKLASHFMKLTKSAGRRNMSGAWKPTPRVRFGPEMTLFAFIHVMMLTGDIFVMSLSNSVSTNNSPAKLGLISFDLDDTLFPTTEVVDDANTELIAHMNKMDVPTSESDIIDSMKAIRRSLEAPITYSDLRRGGIRREILKHTTPTANRLEKIVEESFDIWLQERHRAAERHIFSGAIESLALIRENYPDACVAAITNGRGNPLSMPNTLAEFFDFCVSGEDEGIFPRRKPNAGIYEAALQKYRSLYPEHEPDRLWCHVGDCLVNDVAASAELGAIAVWIYPEIDSGASSDETPKWSTATKEEQEKRTIEEQASKEKVAVRITRLVSPEHV